MRVIICRKEEAIFRARSRSAHLRLRIIALNFEFCTRLVVRRMKMVMRLALLSAKMVK